MHGPATRSGPPSWARSNGGTLVLALVLAAALAACDLASGTTVPSAACGGFQLQVVNNGSRTIEVSVDGTPAGRIEAGARVVLVQYGNPVLPPMPWRVELLRAVDRSTIEAVDVVDNAEGGATLHVNDPAIEGPTAARGC